MSLKALFILKHNYELASDEFCYLVITVARIRWAYSFIVALFIVDVDDLCFYSIVISVYLYLVIKAHELLAINFDIWKRISMDRVKLSVTSFLESKLLFCARMRS